MCWYIVSTHNMVLVWILVINMAQNIYHNQYSKILIFVIFVCLNRPIEKYKYTVYAPFTRPRTYYQWFYHHALHFHLFTMFSRDNITKPHAPSSITITRDDVFREDQCMLVWKKEWKNCGLICFKKTIFLLNTQIIFASVFLFFSNLNG